MSYTKCLLSRVWLIALVALGVSSILAVSGSAQMQGAVPGFGNPQEDLPLKPERKIEFTTDEGTWLSLDVSPDGRTIVFEMLGDIYTLPINGGTAKLLSGGLAFESQPRYSPDGSRIAFLSDREGSENVWVMNADGSQAKRISQESQLIMVSPEWTADGKQVLVSRGTGKVPFDLVAYDPNVESQGKKVATGKFSDGPAALHNVIGVSPSPTDESLYYAVKMGRSFGANGSFPMWQVARLNRRTGADELITEEQGSAFSPVISPDGSTLIYATRYDGETGFRVRELKTGEERWLKYPIQRDDQETFFAPTRDLIPGYAFTPDGSAILASYGGKINRIDVATGQSKVIPFKVNVSLDVGPLLDYPERLPDGPIRARIIQRPSESPDGKQLVFAALAHVYVLDFATGKPRQLTNTPGGEFEPVWSPDGQWIAFVTWTSENGGDIWKIRADGSGTPQRLTRASAYYCNLSWSLDGTKLVALRTPTKDQREDQRTFAILESTSKQDLIWVPAEGGDAKFVVRANGMLHPQITTPADRIFFHVDQELVSVKLDGTDRKKHLRVNAIGAGGREFGPLADMQVSPDGRNVIFVFHAFHSQAYLAGIPDGPNAPTVNVTTPNSPAVMFAGNGPDYLAWGNHGKSVTWSLGSTVYRQSVAAIEKRNDQEIQQTEVIVEKPRKHPTGSIVMRGARAITMRGDEVIPDSDIVVTNNRIVAIGRRGSVPIPAGAKIVDVVGKTIVPGFIDMHDHWLDIGREVLDLENWNFLMTLAYGVTTGRDPQIDSPDTFVYGDLVETGDILGPRAFASGAGIFWTNNLQNVEHAERVLAKYKNNYRIKFVKSYLVGNRRQRELVAAASKKLGLMPTGEGQSDAKLDLTHILDGFSGNEHVIPTVPLYRDMVELIARSQIFYTPTLVITSAGPYAENYFYANTEVHGDPKVRRFLPHNILESRTSRRQFFAKDQYNFTRLAESLAKVVRAGGKVCVGSHGQLQGIAFHWEMWAMGTGMSPMEVLRAATLTGAEGLGYAADLGSLEKGKMADMVILDKNPLDDIRNTASIRYVMKNGELFEGNTLDQVWPEQKKLPPLWWWNDGPR